MQLQSSNGSLWTVPGEHFMCSSKDFESEHVIYQLDFDLDSLDKDWIALLSKDGDLQPIVEKVRTQKDNIEKSLKAIENGRITSEDSTLPFSILCLLAKIDSLRRPKKRILQLCGYLYGKNTFKNVAFLWNNRHIGDFCFELEKYKRIYNIKG